MGIRSRKLTTEDYFLVRAVLEQRLAKIRKWPKHKTWFKYIDLDQVLKVFFSAEEAWIIDEAFLVIYEVDTPWYNDQVKYLVEHTVFRLGPGGSLANVVAFLERRREEAGAVLVCVGTALSRTDAALASEYIKLGFRPETSLLVKEP